MRALCAIALMAAGFASPAWAVEVPSRVERAFFLGESAASPDVRRLPFWADVLRRESDQRGQGSKQDAQKSLDLPGAISLASLVDVNVAVNRTRYVSDLENLGVSDGWQTSLELFERGGDCEDFAAAKYFALRRLGVEASAMRIALVINEVTNERHAVLLVATPYGVVVLDNLTDAVLPASEVRHYRPVMAMNESQWQLADTALRSAPLSRMQDVRFEARPPAPLWSAPWRPRFFGCDGPP